MGNILILAAATKSSSTNFLPILIIVVLFGVLYMTMIRPQRNRQRQAQQMQSTVVPGQQIRTTSGIYGTVVSIEDNDVVVEIAPGVKVRMLRRAVMDVVPDGSDASNPGPTPEPPADESRADDWNPQDRNI